ncbi:MAG: c-type cytochrome [Pseudohongiellaceae bacterium]
MARSVKLRTFLHGLLLTFFAMPSFAAFDQGAIFEIFSNADGDVQYIELLTAADVNPELNNQSLVTRTRTGEVFNSLIFPGDFTVDSSALTFLMATQKFVDKTGLAADFLLPENFLPSDGGTIDLASGVATFTYQPGELPLNGAQSLNASGNAQIASPRNSAGEDAFVSLPTNARFDPVASTLQVPVLSVPNLGLANVTFSINLETLEFSPLPNFFIYREGITAGEQPALFREDSSLLVPRLPVGTDIFQFELSLVRADPLTFGALNIISTTSTIAPEPTPEPEPDPLQQSINRGLTLYGQQCSNCHGADGRGVSAPSLLNSRVFERLRSRIDFTMPLGNPGACRDNQASSCATDIANYIINVLQQ